MHCWPLFQHKRFLPCNAESDLPILRLSTIDEMIDITKLDDLKSSSDYELCVVAGNAGGRSAPLCVNITTPSSEGRVNSQDTLISSSI